MTEKDKTIYYINNRKHGLEVYLPGTTNRFVTVTGDVHRNGTVSRKDEALKTALDTFMKRAAKTASTFNGNPVSYFTDEQVIKHASESRSGDKFTMLYEGRWEEGYDSQSDADMAFVSMLCFWCGCVEEQIDRIFRTSGLMRDKWDRRTDDLKSFFAKPENLSGILNWCLEGFKMYMQEGLDMPDSVENATREYRQQSDRIMMFTSQVVTGYAYFGIIRR